ncbi:MAG: DUF1499 domain-containing protein [Rhodobacteraceae bacterium]|nr:MAG: DUF1499 domain-containing protein [Paracoccaceae bacterium]
MLKTILVVLAALVAAGIAWIRLVPDDPDRWHATSDIRDLGHASGENWHVYREAGAGRARLEELDAALQALPRTTRLAGSVAEGKVTFVTRSKLMGFPDYTTLSLTGGGQVLEIFARSRYGRSDLGVNRARVLGLPGVDE